MTDSEAARRPVALAVFLIIAGAIGWFASFELTVAKFDVLADPQTSLSCDFSILVQCGTNLSSWQGSVFGFPNPILGLGGFAAPIAVGTALMAGARFDRWFWAVFNVGVAGALAFVIWLITQSIFVLGVLCPWCMVVWAATIPLFWVVTLRNLGSGVFGLPDRVRGFFAVAYGWVTVITFASYLVVALVAQLRLDVLSYL